MVSEYPDNPAIIEASRTLSCNVFGSEPDKRLLVANRQYYREHIADGSHFALVAGNDGKDCGCGKIYLETTAGGKSLYLTSGFGNMPDMMKYYAKKF